MTRSLPQYSFLWKWDGQIENLPPNVKLQTWVPQQDLLAHSNLRVFVTHGGLGGVTEAIYHKTGEISQGLIIDQPPLSLCSY